MLFKRRKKLRESSWNSVVASKHMQIIYFIFFVLLSFGTLQSSAESNCEDLIKMDGLFTKAKMECPFSYYAWRFQQDSKLCMEKIGKVASKELFVKGQQAFDAKSKELGKTTMCQKLLRDFPMTVRK
jgi:hypothetical protein